MALLTRVTVTCLSALSLLLGLAKAQSNGEPIATSCVEWGTKFEGPLWRAAVSAPCRTGQGASTQYCCVLYAKLDAIIGFFVAAKPKGLGCQIGQGDPKTFQNLYFRNCGAFADKLPANVTAPSPDPTITPSVSPTPSVTPSPPASIDIVPNANASTPAPPVEAVNGSSIIEVNSTTTPTVTEGSDSVEEVPETAQAREDSNSTGRRVCLHGALTVALRDRQESVRVDQLNVGDVVLVGNGMLSTVFIFTHQARIRAEFVNATTQSGLWLAVTSGHLVHVKAIGLVPASELNVGDALLKDDGTADPIVNLERFVDVGTYNPQTLHGDIVVNGLRVSTYTTHVAAQVAHPALAPLRALWRTLRWSTPIFRCGLPSLNSLAGHPCVA